MNKKKKYSILTSATVFIAIASIYLTKNEKIVVNATRETSSVINQMLVNIVKIGENIVSNITNQSQNNRQLVDERLSLKQEVESLAKENQQLKQQLEINTVLSDYIKINATVISRTPELWNDYLIIDAGADKGVLEGMSVLSQGVVIGRIESTTQTTSRVVLLSNNANLSVYIQIDDSTNVAGILSNYNIETNDYIISNIPMDANVQSGNNVVTSGLSSQIPKGLSLGTVIEVQEDSTTTHKQVRMKLNTSLNDIQYVTIIQGQ